MSFRVRVVVFDLEVFVIYSTFSGPNDDQKKVVISGALAKVCYLMLLLFPMIVPIFQLSDTQTFRF